MKISNFVQDWSLTKLIVVEGFLLVIVAYLFAIITMEAGLAHWSFLEYQFKDYSFKGWEINVAGAGAYCIGGVLGYWIGKSSNK